MYIALASLVIMIAAMATLVAAGISFQRGRMAGAPFYPASAAVIRMALEGAALAPGEVFYDLGAGNGKALVIADKEFGARTNGFEISRFAWWIARTNLFLNSSSARLFREDFFTANIADADAVFCFLAVRTMARVEEKLRAELKPGARAAVYAFPLPTMPPERVIPVHGKWNLYIYRT